LIRRFHFDTSLSSLSFHLLRLRFTRALAFSSPFHQLLPISRFRFRFQPPFSRLHRYASFVTNIAFAIGFFVLQALLPPLY